MRKPKRRVQIAGINIFTLGRLLFQILFIEGTVAGFLSLNAWEANSHHVSRMLIPTIPMAMTTAAVEFLRNTGTIFVHVAFAVTVLPQLLFIECTVF